jgi:hypothetical protein
MPLAECKGKRRNKEALVRKYQMFVSARRNARLQNIGGFAFRGP